MEQKIRKIIHIDMDAFYASVEQRDDPSLRGKAIAVGGGSKRGVITTASYEARKFGVRSAMPGFKAKALCPHIIFVKPRFDAYKEASSKAREVFKRYTDLIEPLSLDEAYLDVTQNKMDQPIATELAKRIKEDIKKATQLSCSAGVSYCKFLAKIASDMNKPDGLTVIKPQQAEAFIEALAVKKIFGVGKVTAEKMKSMNIHTGADLKKLSKVDLVNRFGKMGHYFYDIARGIDNREVRADHIRKSVGVERTLEKNLESYDELKPILDKVLKEFIGRLSRSGKYGRTITLKMKSGDFRTITRSISRPYIIKAETEIKELSEKLLRDNVDDLDSIRLIGLSASNLEEKETNSTKQLNIEW